MPASAFSLSGTATGCVVTPTGSGPAWWITVDGCSAGTVVLSLKAGSLTSLDGAAGPLVAVTAGSITIDRTAPTTTLTGPATPTKAASLPYTVKFNESVTGLAAVDFAVTGTATGCVVGAPSGSGSTCYGGSGRLLCRDGGPRAQAVHGLGPRGQRRAAGRRHGRLDHDRPHRADDDADGTGNARPKPPRCPTR